MAFAIRRGTSRRHARGLFLFVAMAMASCGSPETPRPLDAATAGRMLQEDRSYVLFRVLRQVGDTPPTPQFGIWAPPGNRIWNLETGAEIPGMSGFAGARSPGALTQQAVDAGWRYEILPAGAYVLRFDEVPLWGAWARLAANSRDRSDRDFLFVAPARSTAVYVGTFVVRCLGVAGHCGSVHLTDESSAAMELAPGLEQLGAPTTVIARRYPPALDPAGVSDERPSVTVSPTSGRALVDWNDFVRTHDDLGGAYRQQHPAERPQTQGERAAVAVGGTLQLLNPATIAILAVVGPIELARQAGISLEAASSAGRWAACLGRLQSAIGADAVSRRLASHVESVQPATRIPRPDARQATLTPALHAIVERVELRKCGAPEHVGIDVAVRWRLADGRGTADRTAAVFVRRPSRGSAEGQAPPHFGIRPWEVPLTPGACRPVQEYCGADGDTLALSEVVQAFDESRLRLLSASRE